MNVLFVKNLVSTYSMTQKIFKQQFSDILYYVLKDVVIPRISWTEIKYSKHKRHFHGTNSLSYIATFLKGMLHNWEKVLILRVTLKLSIGSVYLAYFEFVYRRNNLFKLLRFILVYKSSSLISSK